MYPIIPKIIINYGTILHSIVEWVHKMYSLFFITWRCKMLKVYSKNEKEIAVILGNMRDCRVIAETDKELPKVELVKVPGTCSDCPHFTSRKDEHRGRYVAWGYCEELGANVNEGMKQCSKCRKEGVGAENKERAIERVYVA